MKKLNNGSFILKARLKHGNKYIYDKVEYVGSHDRIIIICKEHGEFLQKPNDHLSGFGCAKCSGRYKYAKEEFIEKAKLIHSDKFIYDNVNYINNDTKVIIACKEHGDFLQTPHGHLSGHGCHKCTGLEKLNTEDFIKKSKLIHGDIYEYGKVDYINSNSKVIITCKKHGDFLQTPHSHQYGHGCVKCVGLEKLNTEDFIKKSKLIHGDLYGYGKADYINMYSKITLICKIHGEFIQAPSNHLSGNGCIRCKNENMLSSTDEFIEKSKLIHGDKYNYDNVEYISCEKKINIICKKHGIFEQTPHGHLNNRGCPKCNMSKGEIKIGKFLTENNIKYKTQFYFTNLKYKGYLRFDYGILDENNNLQYLIEYNGEQHYKYIDFMHKTYELFELSKMKDELKIDYCKNNNITLHIIRYDEDVNIKLNEIKNGI